MLRSLAVVLVLFAGCGDACDLMVIPLEQQEVPPEPDAQPVDETGGKPGCSTSGGGALLLLALSLMRGRRGTHRGCR